MKKIPSLFKRDFESKKKLLYDEVTEGCEWVKQGLGTATRKFDGTACMIFLGELYKRYDCKKGRVKPVGFVQAQNPDPVTGHHPGWVKCQPGNPDDKYHWEAFNNFMPKVFTQEDIIKLDGTYELIGEKVQGNPEHIIGHNLIRHGIEILEDCPTDFKELKEYLEDLDIEGVVWHETHPGFNKEKRMSKVTKKSLGLKR